MKNLCILVLLGLGFNRSFAQVPTNGLVGRWEFSGNANDQSGNNNNGTVFGATLVPDRCGNANSAYSFNGTSDYITMMQSGPTGTVSRSLSFWAKTTYTASGSGNLAMSVFNYGSANFGGAFQVQLNYNCQGLGLDIYDHELIRGSGCYADGQWHHFAVVYDASGNQQLNSVDFYIDGNWLPQISCFQTGTTQVINTGSSSIVIGNDGGFPNPFRWYNGSLDDFYLYNRALTPAEVQQLYNACIPAINGPTAICVGVSKTFSISPIMGATNYTWTLPSGWTGSSTSNTITVVPSLNQGVISVSAMNSCGAKVVYQSTVFPAICTGLAEHSDIMLYITVNPNPARETVNLNGNFESGAITVRISDMAGRCVYARTVEPSTTTSCDISGLHAGVYLVEVQQDQRRGVQKFVKQ